MVNNRTYHIIGAGIAGLYAAKLLKEQDPLSSIIIYEAAAKIGGRCGSFYSPTLNCSCDNSTHVVLSCNKLAKKLLGKNAFSHKIKFWDTQKQKFTPSCFCLQEIKSAVFNTPFPAWQAWLSVLVKLFPFFHLKAYFSAGDLQNTLCAPLLSYIDELHYGYVWQGIRNEENHISQLIFSAKTVTLAPQDIIISAIDSYHYNQIMGGYDFEYNPIGNLIFRTSMTLTLPRQIKMLGLKNAVSHWVFCSPNYTAVTISHVHSQAEPSVVWNEICRLRDYNSAFLPTSQFLLYPYATICQDAKNNKKRPSSCRTFYDNLFICGDWTMKNQPCCIETALHSANRLAKVISKI